MEHTENESKAAGAPSALNVELGFSLHDIPPEGSALRKLGKRLAELLDEDQWAECEQMLFEAMDEAPDFDCDAVGWAYGKCVALGLENGSMESAMMMDRLKSMLMMPNDKV